MVWEKKETGYWRSFYNSSRITSAYQRSESSLQLCSLTSMAFLVSIPSIYFDFPCAKRCVWGWENKECNLFSKCSQSSNRDIDISIELPREKSIELIPNSLESLIPDANIYMWVNGYFCFFIFTCLSLLHFLKKSRHHFAI